MKYSIDPVYMNRTKSLMQMERLSSLREPLEEQLLVIHRHLFSRLNFQLSEQLKFELRATRVLR